MHTITDRTAQSKVIFNILQRVLKARQKKTKWPTRTTNRLTRKSLCLLWSVRNGSVQLKPSKAGVCHHSPAPYPDKVPGKCSSENETTTEALWSMTQRGLTTLPHASCRDQAKA